MGILKVVRNLSTEQGDEVNLGSDLINQELLVI